MFIIFKGSHADFKIYIYITLLTLIQTEYCFFLDDKLDIAAGMSGYLVYYKNVKKYARNL
jgi:hypothetical protein